MATVAVGSDAIWLTQIADDAALVRSLRALPPGEPIELDVGGHVGGWQRIADRDEFGQFRYGIRPIGPMREIWAQFQAQGKNAVDVTLVAPTYLATFGERHLYWDIPESRVYVAPGD